MATLSGLSKDGTHKVRVTPYGQLKVLSESVPRLTERSLAGNAYSWSNVTYDYTAADTVFCLENNHSDKLLVVDKLWLYGSTATKVIIHLLTSVAVDGTAISGVNLNRNSGRVPRCTSTANETTNTAANVVLNFYIAAAGQSALVDLKGSVVLDNDTFLGVDYTTNGTVANVTALGHFIDKE